jgi:hypothetical protein
MSQPPTPSPLDGLRCPPFGLGFERTIADHQRGVTSTGIPYQGFDYASTMCDKYAGVATMRLAMCLPAFFVSLPENPRAGIAGVQVPNRAGLLVVADSLAYGQAVLDGSLVEIREFARRRALDLAIDGDSLTAIQVPLGSDGLRAYCEDMAMVAQTISSNETLRRFTIPREPGQGFYGYPGALYVERDDRLLADSPITRNGHDHRAINVIAMAPRQGLQAVGFTHWYRTTSSDSDGNATTTTHQEHLVSLRLPFAFGRIGVDWRGLGDPIMLFAPAFEKNHQVSADDSEFGGDVVRPMIDWLSVMEPPSFAIQGSGMWFSLGTVPSPQTTQWCAAFALEFFDHVVTAVWQRLGYPSNPMTLDLR